MQCSTDKTCDPFGHADTRVAIELYKARHLILPVSLVTELKLFCTKIIDTGGDDPARKTEGKNDRIPRLQGHRACGWLFCSIVERSPKVTSRIRNVSFSTEEGVKTQSSNSRGKSGNGQICVRIEASNLGWQHTRTTWIDWLFSLIGYKPLVSRLPGAGAVNSSIITVAQSKAYVDDEDKAIQHKS
ncbi:hypothetical protein KCU83_g4, partial [Aureobasidium melanogenum]